MDSDLFGEIFDIGMKPLKEKKYDRWQKQDTCGCLGNLSPHFYHLALIKYKEKLWNPDIELTSRLSCYW